MFLGDHFNYPSRFLSIFVKTAIQQIFWAPLFNTYFFGMQSILCGDQPSAVVERVRRAVPESWVNSCKVWPAVTAFSFTFIVPQYRFMFAGFFAIAWQGYLSYLNRREEKRVEAGYERGEGPPEGMHRSQYRPAKS